jgi:hypothetical protein
MPRVAADSKTPPSACQLDAQGEGWTLGTFENIKKLKQMQVVLLSKVGCIFPA